MPAKLRFALALAVLVALVAAGCGSSTTAKSRLIARADAICKPLNARRKQADAEVGAVRSVAALPKVARIAPGLAAYEGGVIAELRELTVPAVLGEDWQRILTGMQELAGNTAKLGEDAKAGDLQSVEGVIHTDQQKEKELITVAATAGFAHCGRNV